MSANPRHRGSIWGAPPPMHFHVLLLLLFSLFVLQPVKDVQLLGLPLGSLLIIGVLGGCVLAVRGWRFVFPLAGLLAAAGVVVTAISHAAGDEHLPLAADALILTLLFMISACLAVQLFSEREVGLHSISAALCIYMLLGIAFAFVHDLLDQLDPGCISGLEDVASEGGHRLSALMYYSFVTLTTLGYGDMAPLSPTARNFAVVEALLGQVVLVVLVARLVGLQVSAPRRDDPPADP
jgi:voltage-gated potassium channel Kch